jgi:hypothetical protein
MQRRDGSLTLSRQKEAREGGKGAKWIPAPARLLFMTGRFCGLEDSLIDGSCKLPGWIPGKMTMKPGPDLVGNVWKEWKTNMAFD